MSPQVPDILPPNTIRASLLPGADIDADNILRPCKATRDWMDAVPQKYIYRCIPLVAANTMGWEILNPVAADVIWHGGPSNTDVQTAHQAQDRFGPVSHFGVGTVTWYLPFLFRTSPDLGLLVTGPANHERNDAVPLDAFVRTDWLPFPFTMNWRITQPKTRIRFEREDPICRIMPFPIAMLDETSLEITNLADDPAFAEEVEAWGKVRAENVSKQQADAKAWLDGGAAPTGDGVWNSQYVKTKGSAKDGFAPHQTIFRPKQPEDKREV